MSRYLMFHKPAGCITANRDPRRKTVLDYFPEDVREELFPVGRLDRDTEGLLLLTDDGALTARLLHPIYHVAKTYFLYAVGDMTEEKAERLSSGVPLDEAGKLSRPAQVLIGEKLLLPALKVPLSVKDARLCRRHPQTPVTALTVTVTEGKKHQIKRMLLAVGCRVVYLKRVSMGNLVLDPSLAPGEARPLTGEEIDALYRAAGLPCSHGQK